MHLFPVDLPVGCCSRGCAPIAAVILPQEAGTCKGHNAEWAVTTDNKRGSGLDHSLAGPICWYPRGKANNWTAQWSAVQAVLLPNAPLCVILACQRQNSVIDGLAQIEACFVPQGVQVRTDCIHSTP